MPDSGLCPRACVASSVELSISCSTKNDKRRTPLSSSGKHGASYARKGIVNISPHARVSPLPVTLLNPRQRPHCHPPQRQHLLRRHSPLIGTSESQEPRLFTPRLPSERGHRAQNAHLLSRKIDRRRKLVAEKAFIRRTSYVARVRLHMPAEYVIEVPNYQGRKSLPPFTKNPTPRTTPPALPPLTLPPALAISPRSSARPLP